MQDNLRFAEHYLGGCYAPFVRERRLAGSRPIDLLELSQAPGDLSDPPVSEIVLFQTLSSQTKGVFDHGAGRFAARGTRGDLCAVAPLFATRVFLDTRSHLRAVALPVDLFTDPSAVQGRLIEDLGRLHAGFFRNSLLNQLMDRLWQNTGEADSRFYTDTILALLAAELLRERDLQALPVVGGLAVWQLRRVIERLQQSIETGVSLAELAISVDLTPAYLCRAFKVSTGVSPYTWLVERRMELACELMADRSRSLTDIAQAVGFTGQSSFGTAFRRMKGVTPTAWRKAQA